MLGEFEAKQPTRPSDRMGGTTFNLVKQAIKKATRPQMLTTPGMMTEDGIHYKPQAKPRKLKLSPLWVKITEADSSTPAEAKYAWVEQIWNTDSNAWQNKEEGRSGTLMEDPGWEINGKTDVVIGTFVTMFEWQSPPHEGAIDLSVLYLFSDPVGNPGQLKRYRVKSVSADHLVCREVSGLSGSETEGDEDVYVAKPWHLQQTPFDGQTIDGVTYLYTDPSLRHADDGVDNEYQRIVPAYVPDIDIIFAADSDTGIVINVGGRFHLLVLLEVTQRAWARISE